MTIDFWMLAFIFSKLRKPQISLYFKIFDELKEGRRSPQFQEQLSLLGRQKIIEIQDSLLQSVESGYELIYPGHDFYPDQFLRLEEIPYLLRMQGSPIWLIKPGLAVVGSREPSNLSLQWMTQELAIFFERQNCFSVSGGARGVDQKAHALSLLQETPTVALLPSGMKALYPSYFGDWIQPIIKQGGAVISEYEDNQKMLKHHFLQRNRLISALGQATLIIEAGLKSGTLLTARQSLEQSRPVWVVPGHPIDSRFQGSVNLICDGATPFRDAQDLGVLFDSEIHEFSLIQSSSSTAR